MGCMGSKYRHIYSNLPEMREWRHQFSALCFTEREIGKLYRIFDYVDVDGSGEIDLVEMLTYLALDCNHFTKRVFSIFDDNGSGTLDFREFALSLWNYCTLSRATLVMFAFDLYDRDSSGEITCAEIHVMLKDMYGSHYTTNPMARQIAMKLNGMDAVGEYVDVEVFANFAQSHKALLFPAFTMQRLIQNRILGTRFWKHCANRRVEFSQGVYVPMCKFIELHLNKDLHKQFMTACLRKPVHHATLEALEITGTVHEKRLAKVGVEDVEIGLQKSKIGTDPNEIADAFSHINQKFQVAQVEDCMERGRLLSQMTSATSTSEASTPMGTARSKRVVSNASTVGSTSTHVTSSHFTPRPLDLSQLQQQHQQHHHETTPRPSEDGISYHSSTHIPRPHDHVHSHRQQLDNAAAGLDPHGGGGGAHSLSHTPRTPPIIGHDYSRVVTPKSSVAAITPRTPHDITHQQHSSSRPTTAQGSRPTTAHRSTDSQHGLEEGPPEHSVWSTPAAAQLHLHQQAHQPLPLHHSQDQHSQDAAVGRRGAYDHVNHHAVHLPPLAAHHR